MRRTIILDVVTNQSSLYELETSVTKALLEHTSTVTQVQDVRICICRGEGQDAIDSAAAAIDTLTGAVERALAFTKGKKYTSSDEDELVDQLEAAIKAVQV